ncbi:MAG: hypothetical protein C0490_02170, partial [Marivirga sp.]|nr:hypothetical protein [Marivirga sp.]
TPVSEHTQNVDFGRIKHKKVKKFMTDYGLTDLAGFRTMVPLCYVATEKNSYHTHHKTFLIKKGIGLVWDTYLSIHPMEAWKGQMVSFGLQYSKKDKMINYLSDDYTGMQKGQIIILNLNLFWGLLNIAVAHEVTEVNEQKRLIKLCYMKGGASEGSQWITLSETKEGFTKVSHQTLYKSKSNFRDTKLYPALHTKAITEFHLNVKRKAESGTQKAI